MRTTIAALLAALLGAFGLTHSTAAKCPAAVPPRCQFAANAPDATLSVQSANATPNVFTVYVAQQAIGTVNASNGAAALTAGVALERSLCTAVVPN